MNKVAKTMNPVVKIRSGEVRGSEASGVVEEFEMKPNFV